MKEEIKEVFINKEIKENLLFNDVTKNIILVNHDFTLQLEKRNVVLNGKMDTETDVYLFCRTKEGRMRKIGIELKENDLITAISQTSFRRKYFNYFYIIINCDVDYIVNWLLNDNNLLNVIREEGIGIVSGSQNIMLLASKFFSTPNIISNYVSDEK